MIPANPKAPDPTLGTLHELIRDLNAKVDRNHAARSKSQSESGHRARRRCGLSMDRGYSPASQRSRRRRSHSRCRSYSPACRQPTPPAGGRAQSPGAIRAGSQARRDATRAVQSQYPSLGGSAGKHLSTTCLTLRPYKALPPDLKVTASERRSRRDLRDLAISTGHFPACTCKEISPPYMIQPRQLL